MTNTEFASWRRRHFRTCHAAAVALGLDHESVKAMEIGRTRKHGNPYPVPLTVALACAAWTIGLRAYDGGAVTIGTATASCQPSTASREAP